MKKLLLFLTLGMFLTLTAPSFVVYADDKKDHAESKDDAKMDDEAKSPDGQKHVVEKLEKQFNVDGKRITDLRKEHLGYGEIKHVLKN